MKVYVVSSRRDDCVIGVYSTLKRAMIEGAEYTEDLQAHKGVTPAWYVDGNTWKDGVPYDGEDYEVWIEEWELEE